MGPSQLTAMALREAELQQQADDLRAEVEYLRMPARSKDCEGCGEPMPYIFRFCGHCGMELP